MDLASKYRAKYPPKEHEEAVRMLLEGIANKKARQWSQQESPARRDSGELEMEAKEVAAKEYDIRSLNSSTTTDRTSANSAGLASMRSKGTSTTSDSMSQEGGSSSQSGGPPAYKDPIPSRTVAVQCELKSSSVQREPAQFEAAMQASSISSTRYGFYTFSQETLDKRRRLANQPTNRNKTSLSSRTIDPSGGQQMEAPTSMSELSFTSSSRSVSEDDLRARNRPLEQQVSARSAYQVNSQPDEEKSVARARLNSLPRRPMTALSYVSSSRLNHQSLSAKKDQPSRLARSRAMSQQVLSAPKNNGKDSNENELASSSDSELDGTSVHKSRSQYADKYRLPQSEELMVSNKACMPPKVASKPPRMTLLSSSHNEQVQDFDPRVWNSQPFIQAKVVPSTEGELERPKNYGYGSDKRSVEEENEENVEHYMDQEEVNYRTNSMSRVREPRAAQQVDLNDYPARRASTLNRDGSKAHSQTLLSRPAKYMTNSPARACQLSTGDRTASEVSRTTSMRHIKRPETRLGAETVDRAENRPMVYPYNTIGGYHGARNRADTSEDSESSITKTWANPGAKLSAAHQLASTGRPGGQLPSNRKSARSLSMRDVNSNEPISHHQPYHHHHHHHHHHRVPRGCHRDQQQWYHQNSDGSEPSSLEMTNCAGLQQVVGSQQLDHDSQHRLNESGLPDPADMMATSRTSAPSSCLGMTSHRSTSQQQGARTGQVTGRAMSQQSLVRPSMPLSSSRRRGASHSGSDLGGSSMSLVSRLNGRYENAYTRSPVVMYIPQAAPKTSQSLAGSRTSLARKSRTKLSGVGGLVGGSKRSLQSRNGSDSEVSSSSMLRTLVKPRARPQQVAASHWSPLVSRRSTRRRAIDYAQAHHNEDHDEYMDGISHLATELDSYKFRRRYSVPKDAKINWFSKLKQRVSSGAK